MNKNCVISVMESDDEKFVTKLASNLASHFESVEFLILGSDQESDLLADRHEGAILAEEVNFNYQADHLFVLSIAALLEIDSLINKFKKITLWFDPELTIDSTEYDLVSSVIGKGLVDLASTAIVARTKSGQEAWKSMFGFDAPLTDSLFKSNMSIVECEPLIEKKAIPRLLVDGSSNITNYAMVEPFITLQKNVGTIDIWCHFSGELKSWMKPDYQIGHIPTAEMGLYTNSVDGVVMVGDNLNKELICEYLMHGLLPIAVDEVSANQFSDMLYVDKIKSQFPSFGSISLLEELLASESALAEYNSLAASMLFEEKFFDFNKISEMFAAPDDVNELVRSVGYKYSRQEYLKNTYGDVQGSSLHKKIRMNSQIIAEYNPLVAKQGVVTGWSVNTATSSLCDPLVLCDGKEKSMLFHRYKRADVAEYFKLNPESDIGFNARYVVADGNVVTDDIRYGLKLSDNTCSLINTMLDSERFLHSAEEFAEHGFQLIEESDRQGCIETLTVSDTLMFEIDGVQGDISKCDMRIRSADQFVRLNEAEFIAEVDGDLFAVEVNSLDEYSFSVVTPSIDFKKVRIFMKAENLSTDSLVCVVSTNDKNIKCDLTLGVDKDTSGVDNSLDVDLSSAQSPVHDAPSETIEKVA